MEKASHAAADVEIGVGLVSGVDVVRLEMVGCVYWVLMLGGLLLVVFVEAEEIE